jgi:hypothetical protein
LAKQPGVADDTSEAHHATVVTSQKEANQYRLVHQLLLAIPVDDASRIEWRKEASVMINRQEVMEDWEAGVSLTQTGKVHRCHLNLP